MDAETKVVELPDGIDFNQPINSLVSGPLIVGEDPEKMVMTVGWVCVNALMAPVQGDKADGVQKLKRYNLARKIQKAMDDSTFLRLNSKQKKMIEEQVDKVYPGPLIYARVYEAFEGDTSEEEE